MPIHDWTQVDAGVFHDFHVGWLPTLRTALNGGILPAGYYAMAEQHAGRSIADVLTLHASPATMALPPVLPDAGGIAVAEAPPRVQRQQTFEPAALAKRRSLAVRHVSGHRLVALMEVVSPANKDRAEHVAAFAGKVVSALDNGIHVLVVDLFPPGSHDPRGLHDVIQRMLVGADGSDESVPEDALVLAAYAAGPQVEAYVEYLAVGDALPEMPLFLQPDRYVKVPLEATYQAAYQGLPDFWRNVLEGDSGP